MKQIYPVLLAFLIVAALGFAVFYFNTNIEVDEQGEPHRVQKKDPRESNIEKNTFEGTLTTKASPELTVSNDTLIASLHAKSDKCITIDEFLHSPLKEQVEDWYAEIGMPRTNTEPHPTLPGDFYNHEIHIYAGVDNDTLRSLAKANDHFALQALASNLMWQAFGHTGTAPNLTGSLFPDYGFNTETFDSTIFYEAEETFIQAIAAGNLFSGFNYLLALRAHLEGIEMLEISERKKSEAEAEFLAKAHSLSATLLHLAPKMFSYKPVIFIEIDEVLDKLDGALSKIGANRTDYMMPSDLIDKIREIRNRRGLGKYISPDPNDYFEPFNICN